MTCFKYFSLKLLTLCWYNYRNNFLYITKDINRKKT